MSAAIGAFPLQKAAIEDLESLCKVLWGWPECTLCTVQNPCSGISACSWHRFKRLAPFFDHYRDMIKRYLPDFEMGSPQALRDHSDLRAIIRLIGSNPSTPLAGLTDQYFRGNGTRYSSPPTTTDQHRAFSLALHIMSMVTVAAQNSYIDDLEAALLPDVWSDNVSPMQYLESVLQGQSGVRSAASPGPGQGLAQNLEVNRVLKSPKARRLSKVGKLSFKATNNLNDHLKLDKKKGVVKLFRHAAFLKEQLLASRSALAKTSQGVFEGLSRQYALEVLHSIQDVLFPPDMKSQAFLRSLISEQEMDPDCTLYNNSEYELEGEDDVSYQWLGPRLMDLYEELENPTPRGVLDQWLERKSRARHVMLATVIGVFVAVFLGILSLIVGIIQTYIAWQQWKAPSGDGT
ncbi:hypothetical protein PG996_007660 [Apiospora saccharicola]|uniref:Uncharacterized protein n=1 Tax=Apiospora saccharicola TaxID=335842 RepID=A0ABR1VBG6_9PEZI